MTRLHNLQALRGVGYAHSDSAERRPKNNGPLRGRHSCRARPC